MLQIYFDEKKTFVHKTLRGRYLSAFKEKTHLIYIKIISNNATYIRLIIL